MTSPLTPAGCDLSDFPRMMLDIRRLRGSSFDATLDDSAWRAALNLWMTAWHQVPAASLEDVEAELTKAAGLGRDVKTWRKVRAVALRGWIACDDGRLYHETLAELALEAWIDKLGQRLSSAAGNAKRHDNAFDPAPIYDDITAAAGSLRTLNPRSRSLSKQLVLKAAKGVPPELPPGEHALPPGDENRAQDVPSGSQGNGMERKVGRASKKALPPPGADAHEARRDGASSDQAWSGPVELRVAVVAKMGEAWTASWLDPCVYDEEGPVLIAPRSLTVAQLEQNVRKQLVAARVTEVRVKGRAA